MTAGTPVRLNQTVESAYAREGNVQNALLRGFRSEGLSERDPFLSCAASLAAFAFFRISATPGPNRCWISRLSSSISSWDIFCTVRMFCSSTCLRQSSPDPGDSGSS